MAAVRILVDTGPLVAYLNRRDQFHLWSRKVWESLHDPLWTCEAVLSEALFLLQSERLDQEPLLRLVEHGLIQVTFGWSEHQSDVLRLLRKYADQPMSFADACLVRMAELRTDCQVLTTDRDFKIYRRHARDRIPVLAPFA